MKLKLRHSYTASAYQSSVDISNNVFVSKPFAKRPLLDRFLNNRLVRFVGASFYPSSIAVLVSAVVIIAATLGIKHFMLVYTSTGKGQTATSTGSSGSGGSSGGGSQVASPSRSNPDTGGSAKVPPSGALAITTPPPVNTNPNKTYSYLRGVNVYTLEYERNAGFSYAQLGEPQSSYNYLASRGTKIIRLAFPWTGLQPVPANGDVQAGLNGPIDRNYLNVVKNEVAKIEAAGMRPIVDLHNGCDYPISPGYDATINVTCGNGISLAQASNIWVQLSNAFKADPNIEGYDLFNETPTKYVSLDVYKQYTQAVASAIRANGDNHKLWVQAAILANSQADFPTEAPAGPWIDDPAHNVSYSLHIYPGDGPGTKFIASVTAFGDWCTRFHTACNVGETGWASGGTAVSPTADSSIHWNPLGQRFYDVANRYKLDVTYFGANSTGSSSYWAYTSPGLASKQVPALGISQANSAALIIENNLSQ